MLSQKSFHVVRQMLMSTGEKETEVLQAELCIFLVCEVKSIGGTGFQFKPACFGAVSECQREWRLGFSLPFSVSMRSAIQGMDEEL